ncbi:ABC transporter permease [Prolixibacteraceae bacterium Z1-6]|uniref:ABC transporter permease n=1 Tax=Draconibacterium aestuarii TaxID=2998507 RepID=A0A9X3F3Q5_9BACT|nr:ABC transporter permease [Prolixibacteraceae bacterium Z1-6]
MIKKSIKSFMINLYKNKLFTIVTLIGFSTALMFVLLISVYIKRELSVDQFHVKKERIFRLVNEGNSNYGSTIAQKIHNLIPEVESHTRAYYNNNNFSFSESKFKMNYLMADSTFFKMFSFKLLEGNPDNVLIQRNSAVLAESFARKIFGNDSPVGKILTQENEVQITITGVFEDFKDNTHFNPSDAIINYQSQADFWGYPGFLTSDGASNATLYFLAKENTNLPGKSTQVLEMLKKDFWLYQNERVKTVEFEPITETYFSSHRGEFRQNSKTLITVLSTIVIVILLLAIINYINLAVAQSGFRVKQIAIKKLLGSSRFGIITQHVFESVLLCFIALGLGGLLCIIVEPVFNNLLETKINLIENIGLAEILYLSIGIIIIGIVSGLFPALHMTNSNPVEIVKGSFKTKNKNSYSKVLVSFQFVATIVLIVGAWTIVRQINFISNYDIGYNKNNLIQIEGSMKGSKKQAFKDILKQIPGVANVSFVAGSPLDGGNNQSFNHEGSPVSFQEFLVDSSFFSLLDLKTMLTGVAKSDNVLWLNETAVKQLNLESLPTSFKRYEEKLPVYGVVNDFHFNNLHQTVGPAMLRILKEDESSWSILVKFSGVGVQNTMSRIKSEYEKFTGGLPFEYQFADLTIEQWYKKDANTAKIIGYFAILAILISVLGILALVTYYNQLRIKEIGIRKVNGAKISEIMTMLNKDFVKWVAIAFVIACPIAYYAMNKWLENFAYKATLSWWIFALAGLLALGIALLTVSWQSWRAATRNPVEALRYE